MLASTAMPTFDALASLAAALLHSDALLTNSGNASSEEPPSAVACDGAGATEVYKFVLNPF